MDEVMVLQEPFIPAYVDAIASKYGIGYDVVRTPVVSGTAQAKADMLGWDLSQVVSALFFSDQYDGGGALVGIVGPASITYKPKEAIAGALGMPRSRSKRYMLADAMPYGMMRGTCGPFIMDDDRTVERLILLESSPDAIVDISLGGLTPTATWTSMQLRYGAIETILQERFPERFTTYRVD